MKSLAIIGMMFCSMGLFAQQSGVDAPKKEQVCKVDRGDKKKEHTQKAPIRQVNEKKASVKCCKGKPAQKAHVQDQRMVVPLRPKKAHQKARM